MAASPRTSEEVVIPCAPDSVDSEDDSDSGSVALQLKDLNGILKFFGIWEHPVKSLKLRILRPEYRFNDAEIASLIQSIQAAFTDQLKSESEKLFFLKSLLSLSNGIPSKEAAKEFIHNHITDIVDILYILVEEHIPCNFFSPVCQDIFLTISALSFQSDCLLFSSENQDDLLNLITRRMITLPPVEALIPLQNTMPKEPYDLEYLYSRTLQAFSEMFQILVVKDSHLKNLDNILKLLAPWLQTDRDTERLRAISLMTQVLKCLFIYLKMQLPLQFHRFGHLVALMALLCGDSLDQVAENAAEGLLYLLRIILRLKYTTRDEKNDQSLRIAMKKCQELLKYYSTKQFDKDSIQIIQFFADFFSSNELYQFIMTIVDGLKNLQNPSIQEAAGELLISSVNYLKPGFDKMPDFIKPICTQLAIVSNPVVRQQIIYTVNLILKKTKFRDIAINNLLCQPVPYDRSLSELWRNLTLDLNFTFYILWKLLSKLQTSHSETSQEKMAYMVVSATSALYEVFMESQFRKPLFHLFPQLLLTLLVQIHHSIGLSMSDVNIPSDLYSNQEMCSAVTPLSLAIQATKTLIFRTWCFQEFSIMEKNEGWALLEGEDSHLQGVSLLANALLEGSPIFAHRVIYLLVPFLNRGNEKHKLTAAGFFVELLQSPVASRLPRIYSVIRLTDWLHDENILFKIIALRGLYHIIRHRNMMEDFIILIPKFLDLLSETKEKIILLAIQILQGLVKKMDFTMLAAMMRTLFVLFKDVRSNVRLFSITLYGVSIKSLKYSDKKGIEDQILNSLVPLLLYSQAENDAIAEESRHVLCLCAKFLKWRWPKETYHKDPWYMRSHEVVAISKFLEKKCKGKVNILVQMLMFSKNAELPIKRAAVLFVGICSRYMDHKDLSMYDMEWIENAFRNLIYDNMTQSAGAEIDGKVTLKPIKLSKPKQ